MLDGVIRFCFVVVVLANMIYIHEIGHWEINKTWDCKHQEMGFLKNGYLAYVSADTDSCVGDLDLWRLAHSINDTMTYILFLPTMIFITYKVMKDY